MKPGHTTSEFWLSLLGIILPSLAQAFQSSPDYRMVGIGVAVSGVYTVARTAAKVAADYRAATEAKAGAAVAQAAQAFDPNNFGGMTPDELAAAHAAPPAKAAGAP